MRDACLDRPSGVLSLRVFRRGVLVESWRGDNLVLDTRKAVLSRLLGGDATAAITKIGFGTGTTAPVVGNTALTDAYVKAVGAVTYPAANKARFEFTLDAAEANGKDIAEFGLITQAGTLFARKVRGAPIAKTSDLSFAGAWVITF